MLIVVNEKTIEWPDDQKMDRVALIDLAYPGWRDSPNSLEMAAESAVEYSEVEVRMVKMMPGETLVPEEGDVFRVEPPDYIDLEESNPDQPEQEETGEVALGDDGEYTESTGNEESAESTNADTESVLNEIKNEA